MPKNDCSSALGDLPFPFLSDFSLSDRSDRTSLSLSRLDSSDEDEPFFFFLSFLTLFVYCLAILLWWDESSSDVSFTSNLTCDLPLAGEGDPSSEMLFLRNSSLSSTLRFSRFVRLTFSS